MPHLSFIIGEENYLLKIKEDTKFIENSLLRNFLSFSEHFDPFYLTL